MLKTFLKTSVIVAYCAGIASFNTGAALASDTVESQNESIRLVKGIGPSTVVCCGCKRLNWKKSYKKMTLSKCGGQGSGCWFKTTSQPGCTL